MKFLIWLVIIILYAVAYMFRKSPIAPRLVILATVLAVLMIALSKYLNF